MSLLAGFHHGSMKKIGNEEGIKFWHDEWVGGTSLNNLFGRLFILALLRIKMWQTWGNG